LPKVSVITAAYNHVEYIRQSVESVHAQTYRDFEHIVVDDGSTDGTADVLKDFGDQITYIRQDNRGAHAAINVGIRASSGEYIAILDSDDAWLPDKLEHQMRAFEQYPEAGLVYSQAYLIDSKSNLQNDRVPIGRPFSDSCRAFQELLIENKIPVLTALFRRTCVKDVGLFCETLKALSDWDLWLRISAKWPVIFVPEPLALYRIHENNTWHSLLQSGRVDRERLLLLDRAAAVLSGDTLEEKRSREIIHAAFGDTVLSTTFEYCCRHQYSEAKSYLLFARHLRPLPWKDRRVIRLVAKLLLGQRGTEAIRGIKRLFT